MPTPNDQTFSIDVAVDGALTDFRGPVELGGSYRKIIAMRCPVPLEIRTRQNGPIYYFNNSGDGYDFGCDENGDPIEVSQIFYRHSGGAGVIDLLLTPATYASFNSASGESGSILAETVLGYFDSSSARLRWPTGQVNANTASSGTGNTFYTGGINLFGVGNLPVVRMVAPASANALVGARLKLGQGSNNAYYPELGITDLLARPLAGRDSFFRSFEFNIYTANVEGAGNTSNNGVFLGADSGGWDGAAPGPILPDGGGIGIYRRLGNWRFVVAVGNGGALVVDVDLGIDGSVVRRFAIKFGRVFGRTFFEVWEGTTLLYRFEPQVAIVGYYGVTGQWALSVPTFFNYRTAGNASDTAILYTGFDRSIILRGNI